MESFYRCNNGFYTLLEDERVCVLKWEHDAHALVHNMSDEQKICSVLGVGQIPTSIGFYRMENIAYYIDTNHHMIVPSLDDMLNILSNKLIPNSLDDERKSVQPIRQLLTSHKPMTVSNDFFYTESVKSMLKANIRLQIARPVIDKQQALEELSTASMIHCISFRALIKCHSMPQRWTELMDNHKQRYLLFFMEECAIAFTSFYIGRDPTNCIKVPILSKWTKKLHKFGNTVHCNLPMTLFFDAITQIDCNWYTDIPQQYPFPLGL